MSDCNCNPCTTTAQVSATNEALPSALNNFISAFFGSVTKSVVNGEVVWTLPCNLDTGLDANPRLPGEGLACYFKRLFEDGITGLLGPEGPEGPMGANGSNGSTTVASSFTTATLGDPNRLITVTDGTPIPLNGYIFIEGNGWFEVFDITGNVVTAQLIQSVTSPESPTVSAGNLVAVAGPTGASVTGPAGPAGPVGATGAVGPAGPAGADGASSFTTTTANFTQPAVAATVVVSVADSSGFAIGQNVYIETGGHYVVTVTGVGSMTVRNDGATGNAAPAATILSGSDVSTAGATGAAGDTGSNAFTNTTANFTQPSVGATVVISVNDSEWVAIGQQIYVENGGYYEVTNTGASSVTAENTGAAGNAAPAATVNSGSKVSPAGPTGADGIPAGTIVMWSGTIATIPSGWLFCDGSSGTPDLTDRCIIGAVSDDVGAAKTNVTGGLTVSGGAHPHNHTFTTDGHTHTTTDLEVQSGTGSTVADTINSNTDDGTTDDVADVPIPYYALAFIMKA